MNDNDRIEEKEIDFDIDLKSVDSRVIRDAKWFESGMNFWVLFSAIFLAGLFLFGVITAYNRYEERKQAEEALRIINEMNRQAERDLQRALQSISSPPVKKQKHQPQQKLQEEEPGPKSGEFYQDKDGVWKNY